MLLKGARVIIKTLLGEKEGKVINDFTGKDGRRKLTVEYSNGVKVVDFETEVKQKR